MEKYTAGPTVIISDRALTCKFTDMRKLEALHLPSAKQDL